MVHAFSLTRLWNLHLTKSQLREAVIKKKIQNVNFFQKGGGGVDPKVYIFEIFNFGKFQVSKWASGMKRLFKVSFKNWKKCFWLRKKNDKNDFEKSLHFEGWGVKANLEKVYILIFFFFMTASLKIPVTRLYLPAKSTVSPLEAGGEDLADVWEVEEEEGHADDGVDHGDYLAYRGDRHHVAVTWTQPSGRLGGTCMLQLWRYAAPG